MSNGNNNQQQNAGQGTNLNTASQDAIEQALGPMGPMAEEAAKAIVSFRDQQGGFKSWEDLKNIPSMGGDAIGMLKNSGFHL